MFYINSLSISSCIYYICINPGIADGRSTGAADVAQTVQRSTLRERKRTLTGQRSVNREGMTRETARETKRIDRTVRVDVRACGAQRARRRPRRAFVGSLESPEGAGLQGKGPLLPAAAQPLQ